MIYATFVLRSPFDVTDCEAGTYLSEFKLDHSLVAVGMSLDEILQ